jgi:tetratricopeptide (TPR) repeat protein
VFTRADFLPVTRATRIELTLPTGTILLPASAIDYVRSFAGSTPAAPEPAVQTAPAADDFTSLSREVLRLVGERRYGDAAPVAERAVRASEGRPLADRMMALSNGAYVWRRTGDRAGAAAAYEQAVALADAAGYEGADLGIVLDNLARLRADSEEYASSETLSMRALGILRRTLGGQHTSYGEALNNLALMYHSKGDRAHAVEYSDQAIDVLRQALRGDAAALEPFLEDNRVIKAAARPK